MVRGCLNGWSPHLRKWGKAGLVGYAVWESGLDTDLASCKVWIDLAVILQEVQWYARREANRERESRHTWETISHP
jgi:hypothetical protein